MTTTSFMAHAQKFALATGLAATALSLAGIQTASAHDTRLDSNPSDGGTVETSPENISITFSGEPLDGQGLSNIIELTDADGNQWQDGETVAEGYDITVPVCADLPQGDYTIAYRVIYSDGHTGEEELSFTNADTSAPEAGTAPSDCGIPADQVSALGDDDAAESEDSESAEATDSGNATDEATAESDASEPDASADTESDTSDAQASDDNAGQEADSEDPGLPVWLWVTIGIAVVIVIVVVALIMRGSKPNTTDPQNTDGTEQQN